MSKQLRASVDSRNGGEIGPRPASTPRTLIVSIANQMVIHLRQIPAVMARPEVLELGKLCDFDSLYNWALLEHQNGSKREDIPAKVVEVLSQFGLEDDLGEKSLRYVESAISTIFQIFQEKVFK
jgi:hypothetical protein